MKFAGGKLDARALERHVNPVDDFQGRLKSLLGREFSSGGCLDPAPGPGQPCDRNPTAPPEGQLLVGPQKTVRSSIDPVAPLRRLQNLPRRHPGLSAASLTANRRTGSKAAKTASASPRASPMRARDMPSATTDRS